MPSERRMVQCSVALFSLSFLLLMQRADAITCTSPEHYFAVNSVRANCLSTGVGAIPFMQTNSLLQYNFRSFASIDDRVSLVQSTGGDTYADCSDTTLNTQFPTAKSSGWLRPESVSTSVHVVKILKADSQAALASLEVASVYEVCWWSNSIWSNKNIRLSVQDKLIGMEIGGIRNAGGVRSTIVKWLGMTPFFRAVYGDGAMPSSGDAFALAPISSDCSAVTDVTSSSSSGFLSDASRAPGEFVDAEDVIAANMDPGDYQICFRFGSGSTFEKTGVAVLLQQDLVATVVNKIASSSLNSVFPRQIGNTLSFVRTVLPDGYQQTVRTRYFPIAVWSFEDLDTSVIADTHCVGLPCRQFNGRVANPIDRSELGQYDVGTGKSILLDGETTYAPIPHNITTTAQAFSVCWLMKPTACATCSPTMSLLSFDGNQGDRPSGALDIAYLTASSQLAVRVTGYRDLNQSVPSETVIFGYMFEADAWTQVCVTMDATAGFGELKLIVNGEGYRTPGVQSNLSWSGGVEGVARLSRDEARIRVGPTTLGAWQNEANNYRDLFAGNIDELAVYDYAITPEEIAAQLTASPTVDSVKPLQGSVALIGLTDDCDAAQDLPMENLMTWEADLFMPAVKVVTANVDVIASLNATSLQLCYSRLAGEMLSSGFTVRIQDDVEALIVNGVMHARGLRTGFPIGGSNIILVNRKTPVESGDIISFVSTSGSCDDMIANPPNCTNNASGWLPVIGAEGLALDGDLCDMETGLYQVCYWRSGTSVFVGTGLSVALQTDMLAASINSLAAGDGHRVVAPGFASNVFSFTSASELLAAPFPGTNTAAVRAEVAVIASGLDCETDVTHGPPTINNTGPMATDYTTSYDAGTNVSYVQVITLRGRWPAALAAFGEGLYEVCVSIVPAEDETNMQSTGITMQIQTRIESISVNGLQPGFGVRVAVPRRGGSAVSVASGVAFEWRRTMSLIAQDGDCHRLDDNPRCSSTVCASGDASGQMALGSEGLVLNASALGVLLPGHYQVCVLGDDGIPVPTGISVRVQDEFLGLATNGLRPSQGVMAALPRVRGNRLSWDVKNATVNNFLTLIERDADCEFDGEGGTRVEGERVLACKSNLYNADTAGLDAAIINSTSDTYQVCFSVDGTVPMMPTGVSLEIQSLFEGLLVNAIDMLPSYHPQGVVATVPRRAGSVIRVRSGPEIASGLSGRAISMIGADATCSDPAANPLEVDAELPASGHMPLAADDASAGNVFNLQYMPPGDYQMCHRRAVDAHFEPTGISVRVQDDVLGLWAGSAQLHDGLHSAITRKDGSSLYLNGTLPDGSVLRAPRGRLGFVPAVGGGGRQTCSDVTTGGSLPILDIARDGTLDVTEVDAVWGYSGSGVEGLWHICYEKAGLFEPTGIGLEVRAPGSSVVGSVLINDAQFWSTAYLPYEASGIVIQYELRTGGYSGSDTFVLVDDTTTRTCAQQFASPFSRFITAADGLWNQSDVDFLFGPFPELSHSRNYRICFSPTGNAAEVVDTGLALFGQLATSGFTLNGVTQDGGGVATLPKLTGNRVQFNKQNRPYIAGEAIALISLQGDCTDPDDNPSSPTAGASGDLETVSANGEIDADSVILILGSYTYQVCYREPSGPWAPTGMAVVVANSVVIRQVLLPSFSPGRCDAVLRGANVYIETNQGATVRAYPNTVVEAFLFRCLSPCGNFTAGHVGCTMPCESWENVTASLDNRYAAVNADGVAPFRGLTVRKNAGRFYLMFLWLLDGQSTDTSEEFIILPHHVRVAGVAPGQVFTVGDNYPGPTRDRCALGLIDIDDVRCRGSAVLPSVRGEFVDADDEVLHMVGDSEGFEMAAELEQGAEGYVDANFSFIADQSDLFQERMFITGYTPEKRALVHHGVANFSGSDALHIRRHGGLFFRLHLFLIGFPDTEYLQAQSASFSLLPADMSVALQVGSELGESVMVNVPEDVGSYVHLPPVLITLLDGAGYPLSNMQCRDCLFPRAETNVYDACDVLFIPDPGCADTGEPWDEVANSFCDPAFTTVELMMWPIANYVPSLEECQARCDLDPQCSAITVYPQDIVEDPTLPISGRCWKSALGCQESPSQFSATIYYKPGGASSGIAPECICPVEEYDGRTFYETLWSPFNAQGTRHVIISSVSSGISTQASLYAKYAAGVSLRILFKLRGLDLERYTRDIMLVPRPPLLSWDVSEYVDGRCACFARPGLDALAVIPPENPQQQPVTVDPDFAYQVRELPTFATQAMVEMEAVSCVCVLPAESGEIVPGPMQTELDSRMCLGCCHDKCL